MLQYKEQINHLCSVYTAALYERTMNSKCDFSLIISSFSLDLGATCVVSIVCLRNITYQQTARFHVKPAACNQVPQMQNITKSL